LLAFPWTARIAIAAPLALFPLLYAYRSKSAAACGWLTALFTIAEFLVGLNWIYAGAAAHQGAAEYWTSAIALTYECIPYVLLGIAASWFATLSAPFWCVAVAALWTLCEYWRATSTLGFPYLQLGHALIDTPFAAMARLGGTEALTFACVLTACVLFEVQRRTRRRRVAVLAICVLVIALGFEKQHAAPQSGDPVTAFQFGGLNWFSLAQYTAALRALPRAGGLAVWPESDADLTSGVALNAIRSAVRARGAPLLAGGTIGDARGVHDAIVYFDAGGNIRGYYAKRFLIPFGESLPYPKLAHILIPKTLLDAIPDLSAGTEPVAFAIGSRTIGPLVCYESAFPSLARDDVRMGANLLVSATNDAWFASASGTWEVAQTARLVALQTGTPMLLTGTVGPSGMIDADGRWTGALPVGELAHMTFFAPPARATIYDAAGDTPALFVLGFLVVVAIATRRKTA
jgi:apolipoprotein N-acyltransferase